MSEETKAYLIEYKRECYSVLYNHFYSKYFAVSENQKELALITTEMKSIDKGIRDGLKRRKNLQLQKTAIEMENFRQLGIVFDESEEIEIFDESKMGFLKK